ncbi:MAG: bifunctional oligoribonuclease/PAP phosphatase NrnA [Phycisphaerales bacterium]|nr:bifunctional oligoribonuclease/PAP phosphatase NrnA [Phycisphaerales bacterium]MCB9864098.1 bifunctional oligoribonuclease/PAP phosphatase NrnA [Phycisphaerales bacterium]
MTLNASNFLPSDELLAALRSRRRVFVVGHVTPDADAIGSSLGLATAMRAQGIHAVCGLPASTVAKKLDFLLRLVSDTPCADSWSADDGYDGFIVLDTAGANRINMEPGLPLDGHIDVFNIDHHVSNTAFGRYNWIDAKASSTCELVARLIEKLGWKVSPSVASLLYAGIYGDTAGFSLPSTSPDTMETAATLLRCGADVAFVGEQLCRSQVRSDFELLRRVYDNTVVTDDQRIAYSHLTHQDFLAAGARPEDIDDQVAIPLALKGVHMAMLFTEGEPGVVRINLRGEGGVRVVELAQKFHGGGHAHAAGVRIRNKPLQEVMKEVVAAAHESLDAQIAALKG